MPTPRHYPTNAARQAAYRARCASAPSRAAPPPVPGYRRWAVLLGQAQERLATVTEEMATYAAARSDAWHASERGDAFQEQLAAVEELLALLQELPGVAEA
jgi:hypothetical protein